MQDHRISHRMLGPCCLCPMMDESNPDFVEAAIYKASNGDQMGEYIAACAKDKCGYVGKPNIILAYVLPSHVLIKRLWKASMTSRVPLDAMHVAVNGS